MILYHASPYIIEHPDVCHSHFLGAVEVRKEDEENVSE